MTEYDEYKENEERENEERENEEKENKEMEVIDLEAMNGPGMKEVIIGHAYLKDGNEVSLSSFPDNDAIGIKMIDEDFGVEQIVIKKEDVGAVIDLLKKAEEWI